MKKQLLLIAFVLINIGAYAQATWVSQATGFTPVSSGVFNVSVCDVNTVWISSYDGSGGGASRTDFSRTTNGGMLWTAGTTPAPATHSWSQIFGLDANTAWALYYNATAGLGGGLWKTTDGGNTWTQQGAGTIFNATSFPDIVYFWNANEGVTIGDPNGSPLEYEIYTTTDGGTTWVPVPGASIPDPVPPTTEYAIVSHYSVIGNTIWFDTNKGRVYKSTDKGLTWTVSSTGITVPANSAMDICFYSATEGIARFYNNTSGVNTAIRRTTDGGASWTVTTATGSFYGADMKHVPGTAARIISTGAQPAANTGSSYSDNGGLTWTIIESGTQRTALGIFDTLTMWAGGFTTSPVSDGIFRYENIVPIACTDPTITPGTATASAAYICPGDTLTVTSTGVVAPTTGPYAGVSWVISSADISGTNDPLNEPSIVATYTFSFPAPSISIRLLINDGTLIGGPVPYGVYYWTPIVFGNATAAIPPPQFLSDLVLDPNCTDGGNSVLCDVKAPGDPICNVGIAENNSQEFSINAYLIDKDLLDVKVNTAFAGIASIAIYDMTGRNVVSSNYRIAHGVNHIYIDVKNLTAGTYIIKAESGNDRAAGKLVKL